MTRLALKEFGGTQRAFMNLPKEKRAEYRDSVREAAFAEFKRLSRTSTIVKRGKKVPAKKSLVDSGGGGGGGVKGRKVTKTRK